VAFKSENCAIPEKAKKFNDSGTRETIQFLLSKYNSSVYSHIFLQKTPTNPLSNLTKIPFIHIFLPFQKSPLLKIPFIYSYLLSS
jgi:hypothetical protein